MPKLEQPGMNANDFIVSLTKLKFSKQIYSIIVVIINEALFLIFFLFIFKLNLM